MSRKVFILVLVVFQSFWMNVLLPGHTRGLITMAGASTHSCCDGDEGPAKRSGEPSKDRVANCAICAFAAHMTTPPVIDLTMRAGDLICLLPDPRVESVTTHELVLSYMGRGPPRV